MLGIEVLPLWAEFLMFGAAGVVTWFTGSRLAQYVDGLSNIAVGDASSGKLLRGAITSLPAWRPRLSRKISNPNK